MIITWSSFKHANSSQSYKRSFILNNFCILYFNYTWFESFFKSWPKLYIFFKKCCICWSQLHSFFLFLWLSFENVLYVKKNVIASNYSQMISMMQSAYYFQVILLINGHQCILWYFQPNEGLTHFIHSWLKSLVICSFVVAYSHDYKYFLNMSHCLHLNVFKLWHGNPITNGAQIVPNIIQYNITISGTR